MIDELRIDRPITATIIENVSAYGHGTCITIGELKRLVEGLPQQYTKTIVPMLGARYRRFLEGDQPQLNLTVCLRRDNGAEKTWNVTAVEPVYFNAQKRNSEPLIWKKELRGRNGWRALLTFGYAPTAQQYLEMELPLPKNYEPYHVTKKNQGFDLLLHDRVILFHQLYQLDIVSSHSDKYNRIRGEIDLLSGFTSTITKNDLICDNNFRELINKIKNELNKKHYLDVITAKTELPVPLLAHRLASHLKAGKLAKSAKANVNLPNGHTIDLQTETELWKIVPATATGSALYLLLYELDELELASGTLLAKDFGDDAAATQQFLQQHYGKDITLRRLDDFPINEKPSDYELQKFFRSK